MSFVHGVLHRATLGAWTLSDIPIAISSRRSNPWGVGVIGTGFTCENREGPN